MLQSDIPSDLSQFLKVEPYHEGGVAVSCTICGCGSWSEVGTISEHFGIFGRNPTLHGKKFSLLEQQTNFSDQVQCQVCKKDYSKYSLVPLYEEYTFACRDWPKCKGKGLNQQLQAFRTPPKSTKKEDQKATNSQALSDNEAE